MDIQNHDALVAGWDREIGIAQRELAAAGLANPKSVKQKQQFLKRILPIEILVDWPVTPGGALSTDGDTLLALEDFPAAKALATFTRLSSYRANFGPSLRGQLIDGCL